MYSQYFPSEINIYLATILPDSDKYWHATAKILVAPLT